MTDQAQNLRKIMQRSNLKKTPCRVIAVTSGKGGVGKSSITVNLAIALAKAGGRVLIIDADLGLANIDLMLGVSTKYDLSCVINEGMPIKDIILEGAHGVKFISGGNGVFDLINLDDAQLRMLVHQLLELEDIADYIFFDTGAGVNNNVLRMVSSSTETILIATPEPTSIMDAYTLVKTINMMEEKPTLRLLINKAESVDEAKNASESFAKIVNKYMNLHIDQMGYILFDSSVSRAIKMQTPFIESFPKSMAAKSIERIAKKYLSGDDEDENAKEGFKGFLFRWLQKRDV